MNEDAVAGTWVLRVERDPFTVWHGVDRTASGHVASAAVFDSPQACREAMAAAGLHPCRDGTIIPYRAALAATQPHQLGLAL